MSNVTEITNSAVMLPNGLGGTYHNTYTYDNRYRLTGSSGNWQGNKNLSYQTMTQYHANGRISRKNLAARILQNGVTDTVNYARSYSYGETQPNTLVQISSGSWGENGIVVMSPEELRFAWDATGNMVSQDLPGGGSRYLCWDEQNRLQGVKDNGYLSYYQYDANGDRIYKLTGKGGLQNISGSWQRYYLLDNATLYASPYLVATGNGYTKHYYAESERIASRIGDGGLHELDQPIVGNEKIDEKKEHINNQAADVIESCLDVSWYDVGTDIHKLYDWRNNVQHEPDCYWYHPDHLGSSSWITDSAGKAVQHLHYLPWGEDFVDQRQNSFDGARYTFSAKEKDFETGLDYFGSRYYSSDLSIWLSVDPMSDKYASLSPYTYCVDNPVKLVDPNGEDIDPESMQAWNTLKSDIIGRKDFLKPFAILNKTTHGALCDEEAERYNSLCNTLNSMEDLEYSDQLYRLGTIEGSVGNVTLNDDESLTINYCNTANFIHEMTHCVQFERGDLGFFKGKGAQAFTDVYDEIEAYTAQAAYDPSTLPNYSKRYTPLTPQWIKHMKYGDGRYIYPNCGLIRYDGNATASDMNRIFTKFFVPLDFEGKLREQPGAYFK